MTPSVFNGSVTYSEHISHGCEACLTHCHMCVCVINVSLHTSLHVSNSVIGEIECAFTLQAFYTNTI